MPGSINVAVGASAVGTRASWVLDVGADVVLAAASDAEALRLGRLLEAAGLRRLVGILSGGAPRWSRAGLPIATTPAIDVATLAGRIRRDDVTVLDVREHDEWQTGHVPDSIHVPYHELDDGALTDLGLVDGPLAVVCSVGNRSSIAASLLQRHGMENVEHVAEGGVLDLEEHGITLVAGTSSATRNARDHVESVPGRPARRASPVDSAGNALSG